MQYCEGLMKLLSELSLEIGLVWIIADYASKKKNKRTLHILVQNRRGKYPRNWLLRSYAGKRNPYVPP